VGVVLVLGGDGDARPRAAQQVADRAAEQQLAEADDDEVVAHRLDLREQVRGDDDRPALPAQVGEQRADLHDARRVQAVRGLVEDEQLGIGQQRGGDPEALLHPEREAPDGLAVAPGEADGVEDLVDARGRQPAQPGEGEQVPRADSPGTNAGLSMSAPTRAR
jgi:hypothetical protein